LQLMRIRSSMKGNCSKSRGVEYSFLFMRAEGQQLAQIAKLIDSGVIRSVVDEVFPFAQTAEALAYVETGRAKGKVVVTFKS
ncbi:zinc-binding dehydrogenase, partial [Sinorhizobium sp. Sb3]|uniref:zinc-binding dehydrogenase n=1 Tax=Sinorhizobium sp. Sb3 TaxID=1358417 RepID=UPI000B13A0B2